MSDRSQRLEAYRLALYAALEAMPAGYAEASVDRAAFVAPVERVIVDIDALLAARAKAVAL